MLHLRNAISADAHGKGNAIADERKWPIFGMAIERVSSQRARASTQIWLRT
jgi:hypothetical protein